MKVFYDERCLQTYALAAVLTVWRQVADFVEASAPQVTLLLDGHATRDGQFLKSLHNSLNSDQRVLFIPLLFGSGRIVDWRPVAIGADSPYQLATENGQVRDCAICEVYEHRTTLITTALFGSSESSFVGMNAVQVTKHPPNAGHLEVDCGTALLDIRRIATGWGCVLVVYDPSLRRPPRDEETLLSQDSSRFERVGRFERNGHRQVYREVSSGRLFYVDNLHFGQAAHLEVFDAEECHLGTADLQGIVNDASRIPGRRISW